LPRRTRKEVERRLGAVEQAMLMLPWTLATQHQLADQHDVSDRQIRDDARIIRERWTEDAKQTKPDESKADWLQRLRMAQHQAQTDGQTIALSRLLGLEARCMGFEAPVQVNVAHTVEQLDPVSQAKAIVQYYPDAVRLLDAAGQTQKVLDVQYTEADE
jgi:hypothetical protein